MRQLFPTTGPQVDTQTELKLGDGCHVRPHVTAQDLDKGGVVRARCSRGISQTFVADGRAEPQSELTCDLPYRVVACSVRPIRDDIARFRAYRPDHGTSVTVGEGGHTWLA